MGRKKNDVGKEIREYYSHVQEVGRTLAEQAVKFADSNFLTAKMMLREAQVAVEKMKEEALLSASESKEKGEEV